MAPEKAVPEANQTQTQRSFEMSSVDELDADNLTNLSGYSTLHAK